MFSAVIVDDESLFLTYLTEQVDWKKYDIVIRKAFTGSAAALKYLESQPDIDVLLTDIKMPGMTGIDLVRSLPPAVRERTYIVVLSGYDDFPLVKEAFLAGISDFILKIDVNTPEFDRTMNKARGFLLERGAPASARGEKAQIIADVKTYIAENLEKPLTLSGIAARFCFSPGYLSQLFSRFSEGTLMDYVIGERIRRAQTLLTQTEKSVTEISYDVGFNNPEHFSRTFKSLTGTTPRAWRREGGKK